MRTEPARGVVPVRRNSTRAAGRRAARAISAAGKMLEEVALKFPPHVYHRVAHLLERRAITETSKPAVGPQPEPLAARKSQLASAPKSEFEITPDLARRFGEHLVSVWRHNYEPTAVFVDTSGDMLVVSHRGAHSYRGGTWLDGAHFRPSDPGRMRRVENAAEKHRIRLWAECACRPDGPGTSLPSPKERTDRSRQLMESFHERTKHLGPARQAKILEVTAKLARSKKERDAMRRQGASTTKH
jgi:hypothetical protein